MNSSKERELAYYYRLPSTQPRRLTRYSALRADYAYGRIEMGVFEEAVGLLLELGVEDEWCPIVESRLAWWHPMWPKGFHQRAGRGKIKVNPAEETVD